MDGIFEGGSALPANVENVRVAPHPKEGFERWVLDFSDKNTRTLNSTAPRFQIRYVKAEKVSNSMGQETIISAPKFVIPLRSVEKNVLEKARLKKVVQKSRYVKEIKVYPQVEDGDLAFEMLLRDSVQFEPHQPMDREGGLVLDLKNAPLGTD